MTTTTTTVMITIMITMTTMIMMMIFTVVLMVILIIIIIIIIIIIHPIQDDVIMGTLTVKENFMFSANLRLPKSVTQEEKEQRGWKREPTSWDFSSSRTPRCGFILGVSSVARLVRVFHHFTYSIADVNLSD